MKVRKFYLLPSGTYDEYECFTERNRIIVGFEGQKASTSLLVFKSICFLTVDISNFYGLVNSFCAGQNNTLKDPSKVVLQDKKINKSYTVLTKTKFLLQLSN